MCLQLFAAIVSFQIALSVYLLGRPYPPGHLRYDRTLFQYLGGQGMLPTSPRHYEPFSCGEMKNISYPFKLQGTDSIGFPLICHNNSTLLINLTFFTYYWTEEYPSIWNVKQIDFLRSGVSFSYEEAENHWIQIVDPSFASNDSANNFCLKPRSPLEGLLLNEIVSAASLVTQITMVNWVRCRRGTGDEHLDSATYLPLPPSCPDNDDNSSTYLLLNATQEVSQLHRFCEIVAATPIIYNNTDLEGLNLTSIWGYLHMGFQMQWISLCHLLLLYSSTDYNQPESSVCLPNDEVFVFPDLPTVMERQFVWMTISGITVLGVVPRLLGIIFIAGLLVYKLKQKYSSSDTIDKLLQKCQNLMPRRYSYAEIKIITGHFRDKLGQGGFGSVFKGCLFDGRPVAVKLLQKAKGGGQDFINEVATIGRIHHVNIVRLLGFCSEGSTRALIYEFMPNGSLDRYIVSNNGKSHMLSWEMLYKIALGIAHGIEYLHRGCEMCILHFDIKPQNVLLDDAFCPKISDFGMAKLSQTQNTMTLTGYRGTIGYIAPEQVSRNLGGVSHKSDVYSFGALLLKLVESRWNRDVHAPSCFSPIYFPEWLYNRLSEGVDAEIVEATKVEDHEIMNKLSLVGLCCIQMMPANRPSMSQVIEMLEGSSNGLQLPPKHFFMFSDAMSTQECSVLSICQNDMEEVTFDSGSKSSPSYFEHLA